MALAFVVVLTVDGYTCGWQECMKRAKMQRKFSSHRHCQLPVNTMWDINSNKKQLIYLLYEWPAISGRIPATTPITLPFPRPCNCQHYPPFPYTSSLLSYRPSKVAIKYNIALPPTTACLPHQDTSRPLRLKMTASAESECGRIHNDRCAWYRLGSGVFTVRNVFVHHSVLDWVVEHHIEYSSEM